MASDEGTDRGFVPVEQSPGGLTGNGSAGGVGVVEDALPLTPAGTSRSGDDLALHVPALQVDELALEVDASVGIHHLKVEAKGLAGELYLNANLEHVVALVDAAARRTPPIVAAARHHAGGDGVRGELRAAVGSARSAYSSVRHAYDEATGETPVEGGRESADDGGAPRASHAALAALAAGLTGAAAGALAADKGRELGRELGEQVLDRLPGGSPSAPRRVAQQARRAPKQVGRLVRALT